MYLLLFSGNHRFLRCLKVARKGQRYIYIHKPALRSRILTCFYSESFRDLKMGTGNGALHLGVSKVGVCRLIVRRRYVLLRHVAKVLLSMTKVKILCIFPSFYHPFPTAAAGCRFLLDWGALLPPPLDRLVTSVLPEEEEALPDDCFWSVTVTGPQICTTTEPQKLSVGA